jgi:NAD(P)-dependent dehydrogenase (short-subunit alcohol dehydrogenase family)
MPPLLRSPDARVVSVTSTGRHFGPPVDPDDPHMRRRYSPWRAYGQAKLANVHFALELQRRFEKAGVSAESIVVHPGFTNTDLQARSARESGGFSQRYFRAAVRLTGMTPARGALSLLRAATDPDARGVSSTRRGSSTTGRRSGVRSCGGRGTRHRSGRCGRCPSARRA